MFLTETGEECSRRISAMSSKQLDVENQFCLNVYRGIEPRQLTIDFDSSFVNSDP